MHAASVNSIYCISGFIGEMPINFLIDSGAAMSVVHYNLVRHLNFMDTTNCAVGANGSPLDVVGQTTVTITLGSYTVDEVLLVCDNNEDTAVQAPSFDNLDLPDLSEPETSTLLDLLSEYSDIFAPATGCTTTVKHAIPTMGPPIRQPMRRLPEALKQTVHTEVQKMLEHNIIRHSAKKDGSWRFCIDYRKLNSVTHRDAYHLPRIDAILDSLAGCRYFFSLWLLAGCLGRI